MSDFTYVSCFSGIGGFEQALNKLGGTCVMASEIDKYANIAYEALYGEPTVGDVTKIDAKDVPDHDIIVAGFPCQSFSISGKRLGFEDTRGTLFFEIARIAKEKQPKVILAENVKGLVSHDKGRTLDIMVSTLCEIGYRVDFKILNSKFFGVPQNRERIFIVAIREDLVPNSEWSVEGTDIVAKGKRRISAYEDIKTFNFDWPEQGEVTTRLRDVLESKVDEKFYLADDKAERLIVQLKERKQTKTDDTEPEKIAGLWGSKQAGSMFDVNKIAPTIKTSSGGYSEPIINEAQSLDAGLKENATKIREDGVSSTLTSSYHKGLCGQARPHVLEPQYRIRRLTPLECLRLQGFPDEVYYTLKDVKISNTQLYKMAGNAVTVNVIEALGQKILPYVE